MSDIPKECKPLQQQLEEAIETLNILKLQDAKLADSDKTAKHIRDLETQRKRVDDLKKDLDDCLARSKEA